MYNYTMENLPQAINHLLLALIIGVVSLGVSFIGDMSKNLQNLSTSMEQLNVKMGHVNIVVSDHEQRIREMERTKARTPKE